MILSPAKELQGWPETTWCLEWARKDPSLGTRFWTLSPPKLWDNKFLLFLSAKVVIARDCSPKTLMQLVTQLYWAAPKIYHSFLEHKDIQTKEAAMVTLGFLMWSLFVLEVSGLPSESILYPPSALLCVEADRRWNTPTGPLPSDLWLGLASGKP